MMYRLNPIPGQANATGVSTWGQAELRNCRSGGRPTYALYAIALTIHMALLSHALTAADELSPAQATAVKEVDGRAEELKAVNQAIWQWAEVGLQEHQSSSLLMSKLRDAGFEIESGIAGMPTAFVASFGEGSPVIGILAEYDALPGMSQKVAPQREPVQAGLPGHACGHSGLGTGALGAAIATKEAMVAHGLEGTIRLYGTPAEETVIGKVYMTLAGVFDDLDICLHWHPADKNGAWAGSSKALVSAKFTFDGTPAHASVSPSSGRSALDAVELMNVGANFMRSISKKMLVSTMSLPTVVERRMSCHPPQRFGTFAGQTLTKTSKPISAGCRISPKGRPK